MKRIGTFELVAFIAGFALLTYELSAARILAPSIGTSTYVWTGVIGVIIAALSGGFLAGGKLADSRKDTFDVVRLLLLASFFAAATVLFYSVVLEWVVATFADSRIQAVVAAFILFAPTSFFIGTVSPYLAKLNVTSLSTTGKAIASLDTFNAIGGIVGTFTTGFILFAFIGSRESLALVAILLLASSWIVVPRRHLMQRLVVTGMVLLLVIVPTQVRANTVSLDTPSAHYEVVTGRLEGRMITALMTGPGGIQSAVYRDGSEELVFWYTQQMAHLALSEQPDSVLVLGGGAFTLPQYLAQALPDTAIDAVEIDPELEALSVEYFNYSQPPNVQEIFVDARTFVNQSDEQYDVVLVDVYGDASIPFSFMTREYGEAVGALVKPGGILVANIIGGTAGGPCTEVLTALDAVYRTTLPKAWYRTESGGPENRANHVVVYSRTDLSLPRYQPLNVPPQQPYTDNFAPAEQLFFHCERSTWP